jgi:capsule biosynthesis phosphatase
MKKKIICFDLDGVICFTKKNFYKKSKPNIKAIEKINNLHQKGYEIKIFTSRFMGRCNENITCAKRKGYEFTKKQLKSWNVKYDKLIFGKPSYNLYVDDKAIFYSSTWQQKIIKVIKKIKR